jgi:hypothetical protein
MNFVPDPLNLELWDTWVYAADNGDVHLFYLANRPGGAWGYVGHAVSTDWLHWTDLPEIRIRGEEGAWDDGGCGTGMVFRYDDGRYYMTYTGALSVEEATGLLVSDDLIHWEKLTPEAPLWPRVRQAPYEDDSRRVAGSPAWRDAFVARNPEGEWEAVCSARANDGPAAGRACVARCRLLALGRWETLPPLGHVGRYASMEVPEIFELAGSYWLIFSTGSGWGVGLDTPTRRAVTGTFCLRSDRWEGPYEVPAEDLLLGAGGNRMDAYVARSVEWRGERLVYHHYAGKPTSAGLPKTLVAEDGTLKLAPWDGLRGLWLREAAPGGWASHSFGAAEPGSWSVSGRRIEGACEYGAAALIADAGAPDLDLEATVAIISGRRAGLAVGLAADRDSPGYCCLLDAEKGCVTVGHFERWPHGSGPRLDGVLDRVLHPVERGRPYRLRLLYRDRYLELFLEDRLLFSTVLPQVRRGGAVACVLESGSARFAFERLHLIEPMVRAGP